MIIDHLLSGTLGFNELRRKLPSATQRMLTRQLREREESGLVSRMAYVQVPLRVDYAMTQEGRSLEAIVRAMHAWGERRLERLAQAQGRPEEQAERPMAAAALRR